MHGTEEAGQTVDSVPESIRIENIQAQAGIGTKLMLSSFRPARNPFSDLVKPDFRLNFAVQIYTFICTAKSVQP
jgi:hypothetical protein